VLSGFFWMLTLLLYARYVEETRTRGQALDTLVKGEGPDTRENGAEHSDEPSPPVTRHAAWFYILALVCFVCGLMSKPMVVTLPLMLLLLDWWPLQRLSFNTPRSKLKQMLPLIWEKVPFLAAALVFGVVTIYAVSGLGALGPATNYPLAGRLQNALLSYLGYLKQTLWPADLAVFYPYPETFPAGRTAGAGLVGLVLSALLLWAPRRRPYLAAGWLWYVVTLLPVIGLIQVGSFSRADRFTYVPLIGVFLALTWGAYELTRRWRYQALGLSVAGGAAIALCLALTRQELGYWRDSETLFRHALEVTEDNCLVHNSLGAALFTKGRVDEAISQYREAIRLNPNNPLAHNNLGGALFRKGQTDEAIGQYQEGLRLQPADADAHYHLGNALAKKGQVAAAISQYQEALRIKPDNADAHLQLGNALANNGQIDQATSQLQEAVRLKPDDAAAHNNLGNALARRGQIDDAISQLREALRLKPDAADAYYNLGNALARKGQIDEAITQYRKVISLKPDDADAHSNLGVSLYRKGCNEEAIGQFQEALRLKPDYAEARKNLDVALAKQAHSSPQPGPPTKP
jgi:tetratricopeptide (TPR) repeat protein